MIEDEREIRRLWRHINIFFSISSLKVRVLRNFRQNMDVPYLTEMDIKVIILALTIIYKQTYGHSIFGESKISNQDIKKRRTIELS